MSCPRDLVKRQFKAGRPNQLWVAEFTFVSTWRGIAYVAFKIDVIRASSLAGGAVGIYARTSFWMHWSKTCMRETRAALAYSPPRQGLAVPVK